MTLTTTCVIPNDDTRPQNTEGCEVGVLEKFDPAVTGIRLCFTSWRDKPGDAIAAVFFDDDTNAEYAGVNHHAESEIALRSREVIVPFRGRRPDKVRLRFGSGDSQVVHLTNFTFEPVLPAQA